MHNRIKKGKRMVNEVLRLHRLGVGTVKIAGILQISKNTAKKYIRSSKINQLPEVAIPYEAPWSGSIDWEDLMVRVNKGMAVSQYLEDVVTASENTDLQKVTYVSFWREFKRRYPDAPLAMHKNHPPGERMEVDYKGDAKGLEFIDKETGEVIKCRLFGAIFCFSQLSYLEATLNEKQPAWLSGIVHAYEYAGGVSCTTAIDNTRIAVRKADRYDPDLNPEFAYFCDHYNTAPLAMRPRKPKDKNLIENMLGVFWRWARIYIKDRQFFSLGELNAFLRTLIDDFNNRIQKKYGLSRRQKFDNAEISALRDLPTTSYRPALWKTPKVHPDCHVQIDHNFYSVPHGLRGKKIDVRISGHFIEVFDNLERVALHIESPGSRGKYFTTAIHLPPSHLAVQEFTTLRAIEIAEEIGPQTGTIVRNLIEMPSHPLRFLRRCQGITRLKNRYSNEKLEWACEKLLEIGRNLPSLKDVEELAKSGVNTQPLNLKVIRGTNPHLRGQQSCAHSASQN